MKNQASLQTGKIEEATILLSAIIHHERRGQYLQQPAADEGRQNQGKVVVHQVRSAERRGRNEVSRPVASPVSGRPAS